jgi:hypothetical protein
LLSLIDQFAGCRGVAGAFFRKLRKSEAGR